MVSTDKTDKTIGVVNAAPQYKALPEFRRYRFFWNSSVTGCGEKEFADTEWNHTIGPREPYEIAATVPMGDGLPMLHQASA